MTLETIEQLIGTNLADFSNIIPAEHREVCYAFVNYLTTLPKTKVVTLETIPSADRNYTVATRLASTSTILGVVALLECKTVNNGFAVGDIVTAPTPYPADSGRTPAQGIGIQYNNTDKSNIKILVNDEVYIMTPYTNVANAIAGTTHITPAISNWKLRLLVTYVDAAPVI